MNIEVLKLGPYQTNCYVLKKDNKVLIIDPADKYKQIIKKIGDNELIGIIVTHHHFDHVGALNDLLEYYDTKVYDVNNLEEKEYNIDGFKFNVIYTKGHTDDSLTIYFKEEKIMFVGDFIFKESIGRTDLGGNNVDMKNSIDKIKQYENVIIYPGHGDKTTLDYEKENNYYFN
ncbi:MAG TPA: MBL fold metallo-hydrolase [Bacilli bacterium]|nr:MBL fold metallo-hydrolase [Bacilli bacterium]